MDRDTFIKHLPVIWEEFKLELDRILDASEYDPGSDEQEFVLAIREEIFGSIECLEDGTCGLDDEERENILLSKTNIN